MYCSEMGRKPADECWDGFAVPGGMIFHSEKSPAFRQTEPDGRGLHALWALYPRAISPALAREILVTTGPISS